MKVLNKRQPSFVQFRDYFMKQAAEVVGGAISDSYMPWREIGSLELRKKILHRIKDDLEKEFGFEIIIDDNLADSEGAVESVAIQMHHTFSTMYLVERINAKIAAGQHQA